MGHVITVGDLVCFVLRWGGLWLLFLGLGSAALCIGSQAEYWHTFRFRQSDAMPVICSSLIIFMIGVAMEIAAFFVR